MDGNMLQPMVVVQPKGGGDARAEDDWAHREGVCFARKVHAPALFSSPFHGVQALLDSVRKFRLHYFLQLLAMTETQVALQCLAKFWQVSDYDKIFMRISM